MAKTIDSSAKQLIRNSPEFWAKLSLFVSDSAETLPDHADTATIVVTSDMVTKVLENNATQYLIMEFQAEYDEMLLPSCSLREEVL